MSTHIMSAKQRGACIVGSIPTPTSLPTDISIFWNYFSAFLVPDPRHIDEIEGILIASMVTENSAVPRIKEFRLPSEIGDILRAARRESSGLGKKPK
jgi:hypothetical protein